MDAVLCINQFGNDKYIVSRIRWQHIPFRNGAISRGYVTDRRVTMVNPNINPSGRKRKVEILGCILRRLWLLYHSMYPMEFTRSIVMAILILLPATSVSSGRLNQMSIPSLRIPRGLRARLSGLNESAIGRYSRYLTDKSMPVHAREFCEEARIVCDPNVDLSLNNAMSLDRLRYWYFTKYFEDYHSATVSTRSSVNKLVGFFREKELKKGGRIGLQDLRSPVLQRAFLPSALASGFPFSSVGLPEILGMLNIDRTSLMARTMASTVNQCETTVSVEKVKVCVTSAEELLRFVTNAVGSDHTLSVTETTSSEGSHERVELIDVNLRASTEDKVIACHDSPFPYTVYFCHQVTETKVYETSWVASNGMTVRAVAVCHMNTTLFSASHPALSELHLKPGEAESCHWMPEANPIWFSQ